MRISRVFILLFTTTLGGPRAAAVAQTAPPPPTQSINTTDPRSQSAERRLTVTGPFDPAEYVRIYEETRGGRILLYEPRAKGGPMPTLLRVDQDSKIVIELLKEEAIVRDMALNSIFMRAQITRLGKDSSSAAVEVLNYSELPKDAATQSMQASLALRTASDVRVVVQNLYKLTKSFVAISYEAACSDPLAPGLQRAPSPPTGCHYQRRANSQLPLRNLLDSSKARVEAITTFFTADANQLVLSVMGAQLFSLDVTSLKGIARTMAADVTAFVDNQDTAALQRLDVNVPQLWDDMQALRLLTLNPNYFDEQWDSDVKPRLVRVLAPGTIDLPTNKAEDGETLTLMIQARAAGGIGAGGLSHDFQIAIRKLHPRISADPSAFYLRRLGEIRDDKGETIETNFAPAPGVTFGAIFYGRNAVSAALTPGIGMNVSLMNFAAVNDFDPSIRNAAGQVVGGFKTTNSSTIQVGAGVTASLFSNALQFTFGWNLNVPDHRRYWGVGFGFLQIGEQIAKVAKK
jgi:hypothetical protein